jgi:hypothetical protein
MGTPEDHYSNYEQAPSLVEAETSVARHAQRLIGELGVWPHANIIVGPPDSGKSRIIANIVDRIQDANIPHVYYIDGNDQSMTPDSVAATQHDLLRFDARHSGDPALIVVDHLERFTGYYGQHKGSNEARKTMLRTIEDLPKRHRSGTGSLSFLFSALSKSGSYPPEPTKAARKFFNNAFLKGMVYPVTGLHPSEALEPSEIYSPRLLESDKAADAAAERAQKVADYYDKKIDERTNTWRRQLGPFPAQISRLPGSFTD